MKLLLDMNLTPRWVQFLEAAKFSVQHWSELGRPDASDKDIMEHAAKNGLSSLLMIYSLQYKKCKTKRIQLRAKDITPEAVGRVIVAALRQFEKELEGGALLTVDANRTRVRILPLPFSSGA
jgi:predicted nuclease of predicted toxin-antitoxin system